MYVTSEAPRQIADMLHALKPVWGEILITDPNAPLPKALPETLGKTMIQGMLMALAQEEDPQLQYDCAFEIWDALPDREELHGYKGFYRLCDILADEDLH